MVSPQNQCMLHSQHSFGGIYCSFCLSVCLPVYMSFSVCFSSPCLLSLTSRFNPSIRPSIQMCNMYAKHLLIYSTVPYKLFLFFNDLPVLHCKRWMEIPSHISWILCLPSNGSYFSDCIHISIQPCSLISLVLMMKAHTYRQITNISNTNPQNFNVCRLVLK